MQYKGKFILWSHLRDLYKKDTDTAMGLRLLPKIKYEHVSLTSFSRMRVDLAAQVCSTINLLSYMYIIVIGTE